MKRLLSFKALSSLLAVAAVLPNAALAHTGATSTSGFLHGLTHPLLGVDHLLAMLAVGMLAVQFTRTNKTALWALPVAFVSAMILGSTLAMLHIALPAVELMIALSVVALGIVVAVNTGVTNRAYVATMATVALFAVFHGHAHGSEMTTGISGLQYVAGFTLATSALHTVGIALAQSATQLAQSQLVRAAGAATAAAGLVLFFV